MAPGKSKKVGNWEFSDARVVYPVKIFDLCLQRVRNCKTQFDSEHVFISSVDWVNIIPITASREVVLIKQVRSAVQCECLEIPGGMVDQKDAQPEAAARRELLEETGYEVERIESLGHIHPNPALCANLCHLFVGYGAKLSTQQALDPGEDISVKLVPLSEIKQLILDHRILHSLVLNAFLKLLLVKGWE